MRRLRNIIPSELLLTTHQSKYCLEVWINQHLKAPAWHKFVNAAKTQQKQVWFCTNFVRPFIARPVAVGWVLAVLMRIRNLLFSPVSSSFRQPFKIYFSVSRMILFFRNSEHPDPSWAVELNLLCDWTTEEPYAELWYRVKTWLVSKQHRFTEHGSVQTIEQRGHSNSQTPNLARKLSRHLCGLDSRPSALVLSEAFLNLADTFDSFELWYDNLSELAYNLTCDLTAFSWKLPCSVILPVGQRTPETLRVRLSRFYILLEHTITGAQYSQTSNSWTKGQQNN